MGLAGAALAGRLLRSLIFEIGPADVLTYVTVVCGLSVTALLAMYVPARRRGSIRPRS